MKTAIVELNIILKSCEEHRAFSEKEKNKENAARYQGKAEELRVAINHLETYVQEKASAQTGEPKDAPQTGPAAAAMISVCEVHSPNFGKIKIKRNCSYTGIIEIYSLENKKNPMECHFWVGGKYDGNSVQCHDAPPPAHPAPPAAGGAPSEALPSVAPATPESPKDQPIQEPPPGK